MVNDVAWAGQLGETRSGTRVGLHEGGTSDGTTGFLGFYSNRNQGNKKSKERAY